MKLPTSLISAAVGAMSEIVPFFPKSDVALDIVITSIQDMVSTEEQLDWLVETVCKSMDHFSLPEIRAIFCTRHAPADGLYTAAQTTGFTADDLVAQAEQVSLDRADREYEEKMAQWREQKRLHPAGYAPLQLEAPLAKPFPKPEKAISPSRPPIRTLAEMQADEDDLRKSLDMQPSVSEDDRKRKAAELERQVRERLQRRGA